MWRLTKAIAEMKCDTGTHDLIAQSVRASEQNSVVAVSNPSQEKFL